MEPEIDTHARGWVERLTGDPCHVPWDTRGTCLDEQVLACKILYEQLLACKMVCHFEDDVKKLV